LILYNDIEQNENAKDYRNSYFYIKNVEKIIINFDYNCDNDELTRWIIKHENNENIFNQETCIEEFSTVD